MGPESYAIDPQLATIAKMRPPFNRASVALSGLMLAPLLAREHSDERVRVERVAIPTRDGRSARGLLYEPVGPGGSAGPDGSSASAGVTDVCAAVPATGPSGAPASSTAPANSPAPSAAASGPSTSRGALLYLHGGAFAMRGAAYHYRLARTYAERLGCPVLFADYRLAPTHPFPVPLHDCLDALAWLLGQAAERGIDPARVAVGGDSAGGALAASLCFVARDELGFAPCAQMLAYPVTDRRAQGRSSMRRFVDTPMFNARQAPVMWRFYLGGAECAGPVAGAAACSPCSERDGQAARLLAEHPEYAAPMDAPPGRLAGLPPAYVETCEFDCLHDEGIAYAEALRAAGVEVELNETRGTPHGYDFVFDCELTRSAIERRCAFLRRTMG